MIASIVNLVIYLIIIGCIFGLLLYLVSISPIPEPFKGWLHFLLVAVGVIILIFILLGMVGDMPSLRMRGALGIPAFA